MNELKVRPSAKLLFPLYLLVVALAILIEYYRANGDASLIYLQGIPAFLLLWTIFRHLALSFTTLSVVGGKLRYQSGVMSRSTRTMEIKKVQDVRVDQTLGQRLLGMGDISIETAGDSSRLTMKSIDRPHAAAEHILEAAHKAV
ncbi:MAG: PH domain-containing protein [Bryobacteraceae bacterium]